MCLTLLEKAETACDAAAVTGGIVGQRWKATARACAFARKVVAGLPAFAGQLPPHLEQPATSLSPRAWIGAAARVVVGRATQLHLAGETAQAQRWDFVLQQLLLADDTALKALEAGRAAEPARPTAGRSARPLPPVRMVA